MNATGPYWSQVNIGSGNGLVLSGNKPLPEPVLTKISNAIWHHPIGPNELIAVGGLHLMTHNIRWCPLIWLVLRLKKKKKIIRINWNLYEGFILAGQGRSDNLPTVDRSDFFLTLRDIIWLKGCWITSDARYLGLRWKLARLLTFL